jgi:transmembrane sensor
VTPMTRKDVEDAAIGWVIRLRAARAEDWEAFVDWLEADPRHVEIYDEVALADSALEGISPRPSSDSWRPSEPAAIRRPARRMILGWGIAASLVVGIGYLSWGGDDFVTVRTAPGERRSLNLADGSRIDLNGQTILVLDRDRPRSARLEKGEALFTVVHDPARPFAVEAGGNYIKDIGTVFNVVLTGDDLEVAVGEGQVIFNPDRERVSLSAGMAIRTNGAQASVSRRGAEAVGAWRSGRLSYDGASFATIADDLSRNIGVPVRVHPGIAHRSFSGVIVLDSDRDLLLRRVAALLEVDARRTEGNGWSLTAVDASP